MNNKYDIEIEFKLGENLYYYVEYEDPNFPGEMLNTHGYNEPFNSESLRFFNELGKSFKLVASFHFSAFYIEEKKLGLKVFLNEFEAFGNLNLIANLIAKALEEFPNIENSNIIIKTSKEDGFAQTYMAELYHKYKGQIPIRETIKTRFELAQDNKVTKLINDLKNELSKVGLSNVVEGEDEILLQVRR